MNLPSSFTTVTPFSKTIALVIFSLLPFLGFYLGVRYQKSVAPIQYIEIPKIISVYPTETEEELFQRCGPIPFDSELGIISGHFTVVTGPFWSSDCRHIAWGSWESGTSSPFETLERVPGPLVHEGLFVYNDATKKPKKVYQPQEGEDIELVKWDGSVKLIFIKDGQRKELVYDLLTKDVSEFTE